MHWYTVTLLSSYIQAPGRHFQICVQTWPGLLFTDGSKQVWVRCPCSSYHFAINRMYNLSVIKFPKILKAIIIRKKTKTKVEQRSKVLWSWCNPVCLCLPAKRLSTAACLWTYGYERGLFEAPQSVHKDICYRLVWPSATWHPLLMEPVSCSATQQIGFKLCVPVPGVTQAGAAASIQHWQLHGVSESPGTSVRTIKV